MQTPKEEIIRHSMVVTANSRSENPNFMTFTPRHQAKVNVFDPEEIDPYYADQCRITFNHSKKLMCIYHKDGYEIYKVVDLLNGNTEPYLIRSSKKGQGLPLKFGCNHFSFIYDTMMFIIVPNKMRGEFSSSNIIVWDEEAEDNVISSTNLFTRIIKMIHVRDLVAVAADNKIFLYNLNDKKIIRNIQTQTEQINLFGSKNYSTFLLGYYRLHSQNLTITNLWYPQTENIELKLENQATIEQAWMNYDGSQVAIAQQNENKHSNQIQVYSNLTNKEIFSVFIDYEDKIQVNAFSFTKCNQYLIYLVNIHKQNISKYFLYITKQIITNEQNIQINNLIELEITINLDLNKFNLQIDSQILGNILTAFIYGNQHKQLFLLTCQFILDQFDLHFSKQEQYLYDAALIHKLLRFEQK